MQQLLDKDFFRVDEVAQYCSVTTKTVRRWIEQGFLQSKKLGGVVRITRPSIVAFISSKDDFEQSAANSDTKRRKNEQQNQNFKAIQTQTES